MFYEQYLLTDHWKHLRRTKLEAVGYKCERCESTFYLQVHHRRYEQGWFNTTPADLEVLCFYCHKKEHGKLRPGDRPIYTNKQRNAIVARIAPRTCTRSISAKARRKARQAESRKLAAHYRQLNRETVERRRQELRMKKQRKKEKILRERGQMVVNRGFRCRMWGCENAALRWLKIGEYAKTFNGLLIARAAGWYCPVCGGSYGPEPNPERRDSNVAAFGH